MDPAGRLARRNRARTALAVALFLIATALARPDPLERADLQYRLVVTLGYGHLLGAALFGRAQLRRFVPAGVPPRLCAAFAAATALSGFAGYAWLAARAPALVLLLLAASTWHVVENDQAIAAAYRRRLALAPLARRARSHAPALAGSAALLVASATLLEPAQWGPAPALRALGAWQGALGVDPAALSWPRFGDLFSAVTLYHLVGFLCLSADRVAEARRERRGARPLLGRLAAVHAAPMLVCAALLAAPSEQLDAIRAFVFSPGVYLYWSALHVAQTALGRGVARRTQPPPVRTAPT